MDQTLAATGINALTDIVDVAMGEAEAPVNEPLELAKQRVAIVERIMKLPYIKATRDASIGEERFVARDDIIKAVHDYAKVKR